METKKADFPVLPAGFFAVKKGGRPKKEARDAAVFLAKFWRMEKHGNTATEAENWIVETWEKAGAKASEGIGETAHVRASIKRSRARGLNQSLLFCIDSTGFCTAVECEKNASGASMKNGARSWHWVEGMTEAVEGRVENLEVTAHQEVMLKSPIAVAVMALMK